jgi:putative nucleotidyltransferase with HDIG domain
MRKKIPISQVREGMFIESVEGPWLEHSLWKTRFLIKDEETLAKVRQCGAAECWIDVSQGSDVAAAPVVQVVAPAAPPPKRPVRKSIGDELQNAATVVKRAKATMTSLFDEARMGNAINTNDCAPLVNDILASVDSNSDALVSLCRLKTADEYTYMHSVSVCALLHDLGKAAMPQDIINKPGKLTDEEFTIIKSHPVRGHEMLLESGVDNERVLDVCRHHHERIDGKGYPDRLPEEKISLIARMSAVCDVYDAVTSNRPYKAGWDPADAIAQMASWQGHFDSSVLQTFVKTIGIYPTGSLVRMASGKLGVVVEQNTKKLTAPKVKLFFSTKSGMPLAPKLVDLSESHVQERIVARESPEKWNFGYLNDLWATHIA